MLKVQCALFMQDCLCFEINCSFLSTFVIFLKNQANFQELGTIDGKQIDNLLGTFSLILDATTILLNIYISLIGLFYFWFSLVLLLISGWGPWLMFHHGDWGGQGGGGSFWSSSIWMDRKFFRHSYSSGIFFSRLLRMIQGFILISLTQETKPFRNLILSLEGILSCTTIPRLRNGIMFCFHHGRRSVFAIGMMKNIKRHTLQKLH